MDGFRAAVATAYSLEIMLEALRCLFGLFEVERGLGGFGCGLGITGLILKLDGAFGLLDDLLFDALEIGRRIADFGRLGLGIIIQEFILGHERSLPRIQTMGFIVATNYGLVATIGQRLGFD